MPVKKHSSQHNDEEAAVPLPTKIRMPIELEETDTVAGIEEKPESDPLLPEGEDDELSSDPSGIEDEIDPFGDKWEA